MAAIKLGRAKRGATVLGTGFLPLDLVYRDDDPTRLRAYAGGTCGNVLTILAFLGWDAYPIARHNDGHLAQIIKDDLALWGAHLDFVDLEPRALPPVVVQRVFSKPRGAKTHSFAWTCPGCGAPLPSFKPVLAKSIQAISHRLPKANVFFFDRASRAALDLAEKCALSGGIVVFEPSMVGEPRLFLQALQLSHIFKYSQDRLSDIREVRGTALPLMEIETLGSAGLRYRLRGKSWQEVDAFPIKNSIDTSGAGDWCTAGILHALAQEGVDALSRIGEQDAFSAVKIGQAMGAWACQFEGARGGMYGANWIDWKKEILAIAANESTLNQTRHDATRICPEVLLEICCPESVGPLTSSIEQPKISGAHVCATLLQGGGIGKAVS